MLQKQKKLLCDGLRVARDADKKKQDQVKARFQMTGKRLRDDEMSKPSTPIKRQKLDDTNSSKKLVSRVQNLSLDEAQELAAQSE